MIREIDITESEADSPASAFVRLRQPAAHFLKAGAERMARVNVEDELLADPRFQALVRKLDGDLEKALGRLVRFWWAAQRHWGQDRKLIPPEEFKLGDFDQLIETGLAVTQDAGIYARGAEKHFEWYVQKVEAGKRGGKRSVAVRRERYGTALPEHARNLPKHDRSTASKRTEATTEAPTEALPNPLTPAPAPTLKNKESSLIGPAGAGTTMTPEFLLEIWNVNRGSLDPVMQLSASRRAKAEARLQEHPDAAFWLDVVKRLAASPVATGGVKSRRFPNGWRATFFWLISAEDNPTKVAEGAFEDASARPKQKTKIVSVEDL